MLKAFRKLWNNDRGNVLVIAGAALPLVVGSAGLATDTVQWTLWKRQLQRAADSAALAGAQARFHDDSSSTAVTRDLSNNNHLWVGLLTGYPQVSEPADASGNLKTVEVTLAVQQQLSFSSMFMSAAPTITATARAAGVPGDGFCVVALEEGNTSGIIVQGNTNVNLGCGMISNSTSASISVGVNGNSHWVTADPVAGVGGVPDLNGTSNEQSYHLPQPDPYKDRYSTDIPAGMSCTNQNSHVVSTTGGVTTLSAGCYSGNNQFKFTGGDYVLQPGTYYLDNIDFDVQGGTITGDGVTIILTGTSPGQIKFNGGGQLNLTAPTTGDYANMLAIQSDAATWSNNANTIDGNSNSLFDGAFYFPNQQVTLTGSSAATTKCAMVVGLRVQFSGNSNLQNDTTDCEANTQVTEWVVRLIA